MKPTRTYQLIAGFALALGLLGAVALSNWRQLRRMEEAAELVARTHEVQAGLNRLLSQVQDVANGTRGFVLTGDPMFLEPFEAGLKAVVEQHRRVEQLILSEEQKANLRVLEPLIAERIAIARRNVELRQNAGFEAARQAVASGQGEAVMDAIRTQLARMDAEEQALLKQRSSGSRREVRVAGWVSLAGEGLGFILLVGMFALMLRESGIRQRAQVQLDRFFTLSLDMLCIAGMDGYFKRLSPAFNQTLGYTTDELLARPFLDFVHPDDRAVTLAEVEKLSRGVATISFENRYQRRDGSWRWLSWKTQPVAEEGLLYATARDVTELRQTEEALRSSEARYRTLFSSIDEGFCIIEIMFDEQERPVDYRFLEVNPSFEKQTGLRDAVGKRMREIAPRHEEHWFEIYGRIAVTGEAARFQNRAEQLHRWYDVYAFRFGEPKNRQVAILFSDITERKATEATIAQLNANLQQRAAQLEGINKEMESFSYSVSHDLRAPLRSIDGFSQILLEDYADRLDGEGKDALRRVRNAATGMAELIDALLALSRLSRIELRTERIDLSALAQAITEEMRRSEPDRTVEFVIAPAVVVEGDRTLLKAALGNLLGNAWKYTQPRTSSHIEFGRVERDNDTVYFVRDNGVGFDMAYVGKLFGAFQRLHRQSEFGGTGVGLATVQRIIHRHGGRAWAEAAVDQGATFYFTLHSPVTSETAASHGVDALASVS